MCGRFSQDYTWPDIFEFSQPLTVPAEPVRNVQARYNIGPTTLIDILVKTPAIRKNDQRVAISHGPPYGYLPLAFI